MSTETIIAKFLKFGAMTAFFVVIFWVYKTLPDNVAVHFNTKNQPDGFLPRGQVFYIIMSLMIGFFSAISLIQNYLNKISEHSLSKITPLLYQNSIQDWRTVLQNWLSMILSSLIIFLVIIMWVLGEINAKDGDQIHLNYTWIYSVLGFCVCVWVLYLPLRQKFIQTLNA